MIDKKGLELELKKYYTTLTADIYDLNVDDTKIEDSSSNLVENFILKVDEFYKVNYLTIEYHASESYTDDENESYRTLELSFLFTTSESEEEAKRQLYKLLQAQDTSFNLGVNVTDYTNLKKV